MLARELGACYIRRHMFVQREYVRCGKSNCRCMKGGAPHGPYWYGYYREKGRLRSVYIGKTLPKGGRRAAAEAHPDDIRASKPKEHEVPERFAWDGRRMSATTAMRILAIGNTRRETVLSAYRDVVRRYHPDRASSDGERVMMTRIMQAANAAKSTLLD